MCVRVFSLCVSVCTAHGGPGRIRNTWLCGVNATILMDAAKALVSTGLAKAGYTYVNSDGEHGVEPCWSRDQGQYEHGL